MMPRRPGLPLMTMATRPSSSPTPPSGTERKSPQTRGGAAKSQRASPAAGASPQLQSFLVHLATERGLAENTLLAYRHDLEDTEAWLATRGRNFLSAAADDFRGYLQDQSRKGQSTRTVARRLAALRVFLRFLIGEGHNRDGILQQLERPKPESSLPKVLSRAMVNQLIAA